MSTCVRTDRQTERGPGSLSSRAFELNSVVSHHACTQTPTQVVPLAMIEPVTDTTPVPPAGQTACAAAAAAVRVVPSPSAAPPNPSVEGVAATTAPTRIVAARDQPVRIVTDRGRSVLRHLRLTRDLMGRVEVDVAAGNTVRNCVDALLAGGSLQRLAPVTVDNSPSMFRAVCVLHDVDLTKPVVVESGTRLASALR